MDKKMKNHYQVPTIKVVAFKVEDGFQPSQTPSQVDLNIGNDATTPPTTGTSYFNNTIEWTFSHD